MIQKLACFVLLITGALASCNSGNQFSENRSLPGYWDRDNAIEFTIPQLDSLKKYNIYINVRNTNDYRFNNIFLIVSMQFPHGRVNTDTLEYRMANPDGSWMGKGIGSIKENKLWYKEGVSFFEKGNYTISISHAIRNNGEVEGVTKLDGITDIGILVEEAGNNNL